MLSLWSLLKVGLLVTNAVTILNRKRFLAKFETADHLSLKAQVVNFLLAAQYLRPALVPINVVVIIVELLFGS